MHFFFSMSFHFSCLDAVDVEITGLSQQQRVAIPEVMSEFPEETEDSVCRTTNQTVLTQEEWQ